MSRWRDPVQRVSLAALKLTSQDCVLDVGCGTGWASRTAASSAMSVVGVDISPEMIRHARELAPGIRNVQFTLADSERLPFADGTFTTVLCSNRGPGGDRPGICALDASAAVLSVLLATLREDGGVWASAEPDRARGPGRGS